MGPASCGKDDGSMIADGTPYGLGGASVGRALRNPRVAARKCRQYVGAIPQLAAEPIEFVRCLSGNCVTFKLSAEIRLRVAR